MHHIDVIRIFPTLLYIFIVLQVRPAAGSVSALSASAFATAAQFRHHHHLAQVEGRPEIISFPARAGSDSSDAKPVLDLL